MKRNCVIFILSFLCSNLFAQSVDYSSFFDHFADSPYAQIRQGGIGSYGFFDDNVFNPDFSTPNWKASFTSIAELYSNRKSGNENVFENDIMYAPDFSLSYHGKSFYVQMDKYTSKLLSANATSWWPDLYGIELGRMQYEMKSEILQLAMCKKLNNKFSFVVGGLTNHYLYSLTGTEYSSVFKLKTDYFDQFQYFFRLNYKYNQKNEAYLYIKTQNSKIQLSPNYFNKIQINGYPLPNNSRLNYPGLLSVGYKYRINPKFEFSIESLNHFLKVDEKIKLKHLYNFTYQESYKHSDISPELALGVKYSPSNSFNLGVLFSGYLKYDSSLKGQDARIKTLNYLILSTSYKYKLLWLSLNYQVSYAKTAYEDDGIQLFYKDFSHAIKVTSKLYF